MGDVSSVSLGGGSGSGAPTDATYVTTAAEAGLSAETVLGTGVNMNGVAGSRPAAGTAGRFYFATDTGVLSYDNGAAWVTVSKTNPLATDTLFDNAGDLPVGSGADAASKLAVSATAGKVLQADPSAAGKLTWQTPGFMYDVPTGAVACTIVPRTWQNFTNIAPLATQRLSLWAIFIPAGATCTNIVVLSGSTALSGGNHQLAGIYDTSGNLLRGSNDLTSTAWAGSAIQTFPLTSTLQITTSGMYFLGLLVDATTVPSLRGINGSATAIAQTAPILCSTADTGRTTLPNPFGAQTAAATIPFATIT